MVVDNHLDAECGLVSEGRLAARLVADLNGRPNWMKRISLPRARDRTCLDLNQGNGDPRSAALAIPRMASILHQGAPEILLISFASI